MSEVHKQFVATKVKKLKDMKLITECDSEWVSPLVIVPKKGG